MLIMIDEATRGEIEPSSGFNAQLKKHMAGPTGRSAAGPAISHTGGGQPYGGEETSRTGPRNIKANSNTRVRPPLRRPSVKV